MGIKGVFKLTKRNCQPKIFFRESAWYNPEFNVIETPDTIEHNRVFYENGWIFLGWL